MWQGLLLPDEEDDQHTQQPQHINYAEWGLTYGDKWEQLPPAEEMQAATAIAFDDFYELVWVGFDNVTPQYCFESLVRDGWCLI